MIVKDITYNDTWCVPVVRSNVSLTFNKIRRKILVNSHVGYLLYYVVAFYLII